MPIKIICTENGEEEVAWLCEDEWHIPPQVKALEEWLFNSTSTLAQSQYIADIGFSPREGAAGGGARISVKAIKIMAHIGMAIELSEYPSFSE